MQEPTVTSPYYFVPAPKEAEVYKPDWSHQVSHDIPFSDGESGEIHLDIRAMSPLFIRNGHGEDEKGKKDNRFCHIGEGDDKRYFLPASSLKGMIRNLVEILSQGRLNPALVNDHRHAVRQIFSNKKADEKYTLKDHKGDIHCGWLIEDSEENHFVIESGKPLKIRYTDLDEMLHTTFGDAYGTNLSSNMNEDFSAKTAKYKYENILPIDQLVHKFEKHPLNENDKQKKWVNKFQPLRYVRVTEDDRDSFVGTIVCTGQAMSYESTGNQQDDQSNARKGEYVFRGTAETLRKDKWRRRNISESVWNDFLFTHRDNTTDELTDWAFWKTKRQKGIPVFFRKSRDGKSIHDMGLTFMYKEPATYSVHKSSPIDSYPSQEVVGYRPDLAETMFGFSHGKNSLKGRIYFSPAFLQGLAKELKKMPILLSSPRSSFYPFYLQQEGRNGTLDQYHTYNNGPVLSGFKRYAVRGKIEEEQEVECISEKLLSCFQPLELEEESYFHGKIRFHNLRKAEIGALLSALSFHGSGDRYRHQLGYAKSLGYGVVKLDGKPVGLKYSSTDYLKAFEYEMLELDSKWHSSAAIRELLNLATWAPAALLPYLKHPELTEFQEIKDEGYYLQPYSELTGQDHQLTRWLTEKELDEKKAEERAVKAEREARAEVLRKEETAQALQAARAIYEKVLAIGTKEALETFLREHGESPFVGEVQKCLQEIQQAEKEQDAEAALSEDFHTDDDSFISVKKWPIEKLKLRADFPFTDPQKQQMMEGLRNCFAFENRQKKKSVFYKKNGRRRAKQTEYPWDIIVDWLGPDLTTQLYKELYSSDS